MNGAHVIRNLPVLAVVFLSLLSASSQPALLNRVLDLDGKGSYVELLPNTFNDREEANVSGCATSVNPAVILECGGLTPLWISGSSGFGFSATLTPAMESAVQPAHSKRL